MNTSKWLPRGSKRARAFGITLWLIGMTLAVFTLDTAMRGGFPLRP